MKKLLLTFFAPMALGLAVGFWHFKAKPDASTASAPVSTEPTTGASLMPDGAESASVALFNKHGAQLPSMLSPEDFLKRLLELDKEDYYKVVEACARFAKENPELWLPWLQELADLWAGSDRPGAISFLSAFSHESPDAGKILSSIWRGWLDQDTPGLRTHLLDEARNNYAVDDDGLARIARIFFEERPEKATEWLDWVRALDPVADRSLRQVAHDTMVLNATPAMHSQIQDYFNKEVANEATWPFLVSHTRDVAEKQPELALQFLQKQPPGPWRDEAYRDVFRVLGAEHAGYTAELINSDFASKFLKGYTRGEDGITERPLTPAESDALHDTAVEYFIYGVAEKNPETALKATEAFTNPATAADFRKRLAELAAFVAKSKSSTGLQEK